MKLFILAALVAVALADRPAPPPYAPPPPPAYKPAPYKPAPYGKEPELPPQPFAYQYGVKDDYSGANFEKVENQDAYGNLQGSYRVALPDGRVQIVTYTANHEDGYVAEVSYEGQAQYPEHKPAPYKPAPYAPAPPKYAPAPPKYAPAPPPPQYRPA